MLRAQPAAQPAAQPGSLEHSLIEPLEGGAPLARWYGRNPIAHEPVLPPDLPPRRLAMWSGWIEGVEGGAEPALETWTGPGWAALLSMCDRLAPTLIEQGQTLLLRPHAAHVLSDPRSCLTFLNARADGVFHLLLDPVAMLTSSMLADASDHLDRIMGTLAGRPETEAIVLSDARPLSPRRIEQVPLGQGDLPTGLISRLIERASETGLPLVVLGDPSPQLEALGLA